MDPSIILGGQGVNALGAIAAGNHAAAQQKDFLHQQGYRNMLAENGAGIMAGDQGALNALAGYDPSAALGVMGQRQDMDYRSQQMAALSAEEKRRAEEYARGLSAEQRAAEAAELESAIKMGMMIPDAATWDQQMATMAPDLVGQFGNRQALAAKYMAFSDVLKIAFPEPVDPTKGAPTNTYWNDPGNPAAGVTRIPGTEDAANPATFGTTLQFWTDGEGKTRAGVLGNDGSLKEIAPPNGGDWALGIDKIDLGTSYQIRDKRTGEVLGVEPKDLRGAEREKEIGTAEGKGMAAAAGDIAAAETALAYIDSLKKHPGRPAGTGASSWTGYIPGTDAKEFQIEVSRLGSGAFMTAIQSLRGLGALSNAEGQTATQAVAALATEGTEEGFLKRLKEYEDLVNIGLERARKRSEGVHSADTAGGAAPPNGIDADVWGEMTPEERALFQ